MNKNTLVLKYLIQQSFHWLVTGIFIPVLILLLQSLNLNLFEIGIVMAVYVASTAILEIPLGGVADKFGRKNIYLLSLLINTLGYIVLASSVTFNELLLAAAVLGSARAIYSGTLDAWFYDEFQTASGTLSYHDAIAKVNVGLTIGLAFGALIGGMLPDLAKNISVTWNNPFEINIYVMIVGNCLLMILTTLLVKESFQPSTNESQNESIVEKVRKAVVLVSSNMIVGRILFTMFGCGIVLSCVENFWQPFLNNILSAEGYGITMFGVITALYFATAALSSYTSIHLSRWLKNAHARLLLISRILAGIFIAMLGLAESLYGFTAFYLAFFYFLTVGNNAESTLLNDNTPSNVRSTMLSICSVAITVGAVMSSILFGFVSEYWGIEISWFICGAILTSSSLLFLKMGHSPTASAIELSKQ